MKRPLALLLFVSVFPPVFPLWTSLSAQTCQPGELRVFVLDSQQAPISDALVRVQSGSAPLAENSTHTLGSADFENVPCGAWNVAASKDGFEASSVTAQVTAGASAEITLTLNPKAQRTSVDVKDTPPPIETTATPKQELRPADVKPLPTNPVNVADTLPLIPGVVRTSDGELQMDGVGEHRSALVVNQTDVTDPATGKFGQTVPVDAVETVNVLTTPFVAQYGRFTSGVVAVETRRGGEKWHAELNDPFPDFRVRSWHMRGIRNETPRAFLGGPLIHERLYFHTALVYYYQRDSSRTLPFPYNESKQQYINSFSQLDFIASPKQIVTATLHASPQHTNFVNPEYFNPQQVTPSYAQHNYVGTIADHLGLFNGILDSTISVQDFDAFIGAQGGDDMVLTPFGNRGNYFGRQNRSARRTEWLETLSLAPLRLAGTHLVKTGTSVTGSSDEGQFTYRPIDILNTANRPLERIDFSNRNPFSRNDLEVSTYAQDHWSLNSKLAFDFGARLEHQKLASRFRIAPRAGVAWTPFQNQRTVFRAGYGQFYDHIPLAVYTFGRYPTRTITYYAPDGSVLGSPVDYVNVIGSVTGPSSFLVHGQPIPGGFAPRGATWNLQVEHSFSSLLRIRAVYTANRSVGLLVLEPAVLADVNEVLLNGNGSSRYRQAEVTAKFAWRDSQQLVVSYVRSRSQGNLNTFDTFLGNFPTPLLRPAVYSNLPADLPNRFLMWGRLKTHVWNLTALPIVEYRNGFPYARLDEFQNYAGVPNTDATRFPRFFSADARLMRDFKINPKYTVRLSLTTFNITNHFNALAVHANTSDPLCGVFFGNYHRRYRGDFEVIF
jgi:hypothetical protein